LSSISRCWPRRRGQEVINEIYYFKDKAGRDLGLRFDMTVPVARALLLQPRHAEAR
jgi:histidyl-tRNA synthetase